MINFLGPEATLVLGSETTLVLIVIPANLHYQFFTLRVHFHIYISYHIVELIFYRPVLIKPQILILLSTSTGCD